MKKSILDLQGLQILSKEEQIKVKGADLFNDPCRIQQACCGTLGYPPCYLK